MDKTLDEIISENIKFEIEHSGKKKTDTANAVGVTKSTISEYISGRAQPSLS